MKLITPPLPCIANYLICMPHLGTDGAAGPTRYCEVTLIYHQKAMHENEQFICTDCGASLESMKQLNSHKRKHKSYFVTNLTEVFPKITSRDIRSFAANISFLCVMIDLLLWSVSGVTSQYLVGPAAPSVSRCDQNIIVWYTRTLLLLFGIPDFQPILVNFSQFQQISADFSQFQLLLVNFCHFRSF